MIQLGLKQVYSVLDKQHVPRSHLPSLSFSPLRVTKCPELSEGLLQLGRLLQQFKLVSGASAAHGKAQTSTLAEGQHPLTGKAHGGRV